MALTAPAQRASLASHRMADCGTMRSSTATVTAAVHIMKLGGPRSSPTHVLGDGSWRPLLFRKIIRAFAKDLVIRS